MHGRSTKQRRAAMRRKAWLRNWTRPMSSEGAAIIEQARASIHFGTLVARRLFRTLVYAETPKETK